MWQANKSMTLAHIRSRKVTVSKEGKGCRWNKREGEEKGRASYCNHRLFRLIMCLDVLNAQAEIVLPHQSRRRTTYKTIV